MKRRGFTLIEVLIALTISGIVIGSVVGLMMSSMDHYLIGRKQVEKQQTVRFAVDAVSKVIRGAGNDPYEVFDSALIVTDSTLRVRSDNNPVDGAVTSLYEDVLIFMSGDTLYFQDVTTNVVEPQFVGVDSIYFESFAANGTPTTEPAQIRRVRIVARTGDVEYELTVIPRPLM